MILTFNKKNDDETYNFSVQITDAELNYLVTFAIESLIQIGAIFVQQNTEEPQQVTLPVNVPPQQVN